MSAFPSSHFGSGANSSNFNGPSQHADRVHPSEHAEDSAIDIALRTVPLPDGLLTRLGMLVYTMPEDAPDQVDWLGC